MKWRNVTKAEPCPICEKPDWCRHGELGTHCMRSDGGKTMKGGGSFFPYAKSAAAKPVYRAPEPEKEIVHIDPAALIHSWLPNTDLEWVENLAKRLGLTPDSLSLMTACWAPEHNAWAFPMRDGRGQIVGIRLRADSGKKWAVTGSRQGIFIPDMAPQPVAFICEGPTDTAAVVSLGLYAVGRPSCSGGNDLVKTHFRLAGIKKAVLAADNDTPGLKGVAKLAGEIGVPTSTLIPPAKDMREFVKIGATRALVESMTRNLVWQQP